MSPEQARGQTVDKRSDIWAFGCVLFELLTRRRAFEGATLSDTLAAVLNREPDWTLLPSTTPARVVEVLRRCLTKDVTRRARDIGDVALDLDAARTDNEGNPAAHGTHVTSVAWKVAGTVATLVASVAVFLLWQRGEPAAAPGRTAPAISAMRRVTSDPGLSTDPSLSADGRMPGLFIQPRRRGQPRHLRAARPPAARHFDSHPILLTTTSRTCRRTAAWWSFVSERSPRGIYVASALGGEARLLAPDGMRPVFSPDGSSIAFWTGSWLAPARQRRGTGRRS